MPNLGKCIEIKASMTPKYEFDLPLVPVGEAEPVDALAREWWRPTRMNIIAASTTTSPT